MLKGTIIITGANGGLGTAMAEQMLATPSYGQYHIIFTVRNVEKADALRSAITKCKSLPHKHEILALNLSSLASGRAVADDINQRVAAGTLPPIRALILNAGFQAHGDTIITGDGFDETFQANYLTHWLLTLKLLHSIDRQEGRIVVLGSGLHDPYDKRHGTNQMNPFKEEKWRILFPDAETLARGRFSTPKEDPSMPGAFRRYGSGKLCQVMMIHELQTRMDGDAQLCNVCILGVDPGVMPTSLTRRSGALFYGLMRVAQPIMASIQTMRDPNGMFRTTAKSAADVLRAAFDVETLGPHPKDVYLDGSAIAETSAESRDKRKLVELWERSVEYTSLQEDETPLTWWR